MVEGVDIRKVIKNVFYLYFRLFTVIIINLFATRVILKNLGVTDYGIFSVVGGVIVLITFFVNALVSSTQRHLSYDLTEKDNKIPNNTFNASVRIILVFSVIVIILGQILGNYIFSCFLTIPDNRIDAAFFIYQSVLIIFVIKINMIPYQSLIIAKERLGVIAFHDIFESVGKLIAAYVIILIPIDNLKSYGFLLVLNTILATSIYIYFCFVNYNECKLNFNTIQKLTYVKITSFAGWTSFGAFTWLIRNQGSAIILNLFLGPAINASFGIAYQISNQIINFSSNLLNAINPQIVISYGRGELHLMKSLLNASCKFSFFLFTYISIPLYFEIEYILNIWLEEVPEYTVIFSRLLIINSMIDILIGPMVTAIQATGKIKNYQIVSGLIFLLNIPVVFVLLYYEFSPDFVVYSNILFTIVVGLIRLFYLKYLLSFSFNEWIRKVLLIGIFVLILDSVIYLNILNLIIPQVDCVSDLLLICVLNTIVLSLIIFIFGISKSDQTFFKKKLFKKIK
jgi:O-antigen/teichoic acid export membrane protein